MVVLSQPAADLAVQELKAAPQRSLVACSSPALRRYQHYAATLGRELALLLLCQGSSALTAVARVTFRLVRVLGLRLHHWLANNELPRAAVAVLARAFRSLRLALQQHVAQPLGRLLTQLVWIQIQLSTDEVPEEGTRLSARLNSCVSLLFGSIRWVGWGGATTFGRFLLSRAMFVSDRAAETCRQSYKGDGNLLLITAAVWVHEC